MNIYKFVDSKQTILRDGGYDLRGLRTTDKSITIKHMNGGKFQNRRWNATGEINVLVLPLILTGLFLVVSVGFGAWAYMSRSDYKDRSDQKVAVAVKTAIAQEDIIKDKQHAEADKLPLKTYIGPDQYGSLHITYPKTWSAYINTGSSSGQPVDDYFHPNAVPYISDQSVAFALRVQVLAQSYASTVRTFTEAVNAKRLTATPYSLPKVPSVVGIRYEGTIDPNAKETGTMIVLPLRDKTLKIWTEGPSFTADFNNSVLPNFTFSP